MSARFLPLLTAVAFVVLPASSDAQSRRIEFGLDAGFSVTSASEGDSESLTSFSLPLPAVRVGFFVSDRVSIEPVASLDYTSVDDFSLTSYAVAVGALYHFTADRTRPQFFVRPLVGYTGMRSDGESNGAALVGAGVGVKMPQGDRFALRFGAEYQRRFEDGDIPALNQYGATFGLSFFVR